jgi:hypothetical protein
VVPLPEQLHAEKWNIAELKLSSLEELKIENFSALL